MLDVLSSLVVLSSELVVSSLLAAALLSSELELESLWLVDVDEL